MRRYYSLLLLAACTASGKAGLQSTCPTGVPNQSAPAPQAQAPAHAAKAAAGAEPDAPTGAAAARDAELAKTAASLVDAFVNMSAAFSRDGRKVIFNSNRDGLPQLYVADAAKPDASATRLVTTSQRVADFATTKDGKSVLFRSDKGADENWDIFKVDLDGKNSVQLTSGEPLNRDSPHVADGKPDTMFYSARKMSDSASTLWAQPLKPSESPKKIYGEAGTGFLAHVSTDGKWAAWIRVPSRTNATLVLVDVGSGASKVVYPTSGEVAVNDAAFSHDGKRLYVATDGGGEQALVLAFDTKTLKEVGRYVETKPATAAINSLVTSKVGNLLALNVLAGNRSEVRVLDGATLKPKVEVKVPLGFGSAGKFSEDGKRLTISWSTPEAPADVHVVDVKTGAMTALRKEPRPTLTGLAPIETQVLDIPAHDGLKIPVNLYLPAGASGKKLPVIINYHGGPAGAAVVRWDPLPRFFLGQGYVWIEPNVRGSAGFGRGFEMADNGAKRPEAFKDVEAVGRWAAAQAWADPKKLVVFGGSYGGYTTLIALTRQADLWRAGVDLFGVANLRSFLRTTSGVIRELFKTEFGDLEKDAEMLDAQSPMRDVDKIVDPLFVYAGANDPRVPKSESDQIVKALRERRVPVEYMVANDEGHSLARRDNRVTLSARVARFLETELAK